MLASVTNRPGLPWNWPKLPATLGLRSSLRCPDRPLPAYSLPIPCTWHWRVWWAGPSPDQPFPRVRGLPSRGRPVPPAVPAARHDPASLAPPRRRHETDPQLRSESRGDRILSDREDVPPDRADVGSSSASSPWSIRRPGGRPCPV